MKLILICILSLPLLAEGKFITGIGYIQPDDYRTDNEINPLPFGLSIVPMIAYRSKRLRIFGPNVTLALLQGAIGFNLHLNVAGDRYKAYEVEQREVAIHGGVSLRLLFLVFKHEQDFFKTNNGSINSISLAKPFRMGRLTIIPRVRKEFLSREFTNYYYGVRESEVGEFNAYSLETASNMVYGLVTNLKLTESSTLALNYTYRVFDQVIANSPTIALEAFGTTSFFYNVSF